MRLVIYLPARAAEEGLCPNEGGKKKFIGILLARRTDKLHYKPFSAETVLSSQANDVPYALTAPSVVQADRRLSRRRAIHPFNDERQLRLSFGFKCNCSGECAISQNAVNFDPRQ